MPLLQKRLTKNCWKGRKGHSPNAIVLHRCEGGGLGCLATILDETTERSYHFLVMENGEIIQTVETTDSAWHAGKVNNPIWKGIKDGVNPNLYTIGVSLAGCSNGNTTMEQWTSLFKLIVFLAREHNISIDDDHVVYHKEIDSRKSDFGDLKIKPIIVQILKLYSQLPWQGF